MCVCGGGRGRVRPMSPTMGNSAFWYFAILLKMLWHTAKYVKNYGTETLIQNPTKHQDGTFCESK